MNVLIQLSHPAHFHVYKNIAQGLINDEHKVLFVIKSKDILEELLQKAGLPYVNINEHAHRGSKFGILWDMLMRDFRLVRLCRKHKIDLITGSTPEVAHVSWLLRIHGVNVGEDDAAIVPAFGKVAAPFIQCLVTPNTCDNGKMEPISVHYPGFQKLAYLHPKRFAPNSDIVRGYGIGLNGDASLNGAKGKNGGSRSANGENGGNPFEPYFLLRFAKLNAHHDNGVSGISTEIAQRLVDILSPHGKIYITSERELEPQFEKYRLQINPLDIHHVMAFATLYIGDSQSMAVEAAMLGVPGVRFNDFVGKKKIGVMEELEHAYGLTYGISSKRPDLLYEKIEELLGNGENGENGVNCVREEWQRRREKMLSEKIDVTAFLTYFIEGYPATINEVRTADNSFWARFK